MSSIPFADLSALTDDATARQLAVDPSTPPAELERLLGRGAEIDRALVRHPNVPLHVYRALAPNYPLSACANPAIGRLIEEEPGLIRAIPRLCEQPLCPPSQLGWVARHGSRGQQLAVLRNPAVPDDVRASLTPAHFHNDALRRLESLALAQPTPVRRRFVEAHARLSRPYCLPRYLPLDRANPAHRFADQVGVGFPFTSAAWPWPQVDGKPLQPVAQINLERAGKLLGEPLGAGLLQCWKVVLPRYLSQYEPFIRHIPEAALTDAPSDACLLDVASDLDRDKSQGGNGLDHDAWWVDPRVDWIPMGHMFPNPLLAMVGEWQPEHLGFADWYDAEAFATEIKQVGIPSDLAAYFGQAEGVRLGGFPDAVDLHASGWLDWDQFIEAMPLSFDTILVLAGRCIIAKCHLSSPNA
ncbi:MAG: hypothetical protein IPF39_16495 [Comamonadaceae bacterium]|uniref:hypothetical protein n=1 Tax=Candidatus Skiveiella danica TaxID=3386177 RepID=UPI0039092B18|nr:hypothetical protein [Comamonadaceae bacterium]